MLAIEIGHHLRQEEQHPGSLEKASDGHNTSVGALLQLHQGNRSLEGVSIEVGRRSL